MLFYILTVIFIFIMLTFFHVFILVTTIVLLSLMSFILLSPLLLCFCSYVLRFLVLWQGFRIIWTEIQDSGPGPPSIGLLCESTYHFQCEVGYCISDKLRCDGIKNCGPGDDSDELHCESWVSRTVQFNFIPS